MQGGVDKLSTAGVYDIIISGGEATGNYTIVDRIGAKLIVNEADSSTCPPTDLPAEEHEAYINGYENGTFHPGSGFEYAGRGDHNAAIKAASASHFPRKSAEKTLKHVLAVLL